MLKNSVSMTGICKGFGGITVLDHVNLNLEKGDIHALVGGNGAGKSTLMKIMTGVYTCDSGEIQVDGAVQHISNTKDSEKCGIRMIFQELSLIPTLTVTENIFLNHEIKKGRFLNKAAMDKKARELLADLEIEVDVHAKIENLEVGICQLIEIAKALSVDAKVLIMDEPTASLTEEETALLFKIMRRLKEKGVTIVYISHRLKEVMEITDKVSVLRDGKVVITAATASLTMEMLVSHMMGEKAVNQFVYKERDTKVSNEIMLKVENLSWSSNQHSVSFDLYKGEVLGIIGLLGSGRTEILEVLFGLRRQGAAKIILEDKQLKITNPRHSIERGITLIPEDRRRQGVLLGHSAEFNITLTNLKSLCRLGRLQHKRCNRLSEECRTEFGIKMDGIKAPLFSLSGGNQQKITISKWFKTNPKVLLMDEPTAGVDIGAKGEIVRIVRDFVENQGSVIFVSSELAEVMAICDRVLVLRDGQVINQILREDIRNEEVLQNAIQC